MKGSPLALIALPLILAPPTITLGPYAITLPEMMVLVGGILLVFRQTSPTARIAPILLVYLAAYTLGWAGAVYNGFEWGVGFSLGSVIPLAYAFALTAFGYIVGRYSGYGIEAIVTSRFTRWVILFVALLAIAYPFISPAMRAALFRPFLFAEFIPRLSYPRFPGLGLNVNAYSFMVYVFFLFTMSAFLSRRVSWLLPFGCFMIILAGASRTITGVSLGTAVALFGVSLAPRIRKESRALFDGFRSRQRALLIVGTVFGIGLPLVMIYGSQIAEVFTLYDRVQDLLSGNEESGLINRKGIWAIGYERVQFAPVLGIARDVARPETDTNALYYYTPHNEFLYFWSLYGLLGLLAHVFLIVYLVAANLRARSGIEWLILYGAMVVQMMFDSVFQGPRIVAFAFIVIGLNMRYLAEKRGRVAAQPPPTPSPSPAYA